MKINVIGCGRWGTFIAYYLHSIGEEVSLYGRAGDKTMQGLLETRKNQYLTLPEDFSLITDLDKTLEADTIVISVPSQAARAVFGDKRSRHGACWRAGAAPLYPLHEGHRDRDDDAPVRGDGAVRRARQPRRVLDRTRAR